MPQKVFQKSHLVRLTHDGEYIYRNRTSIIGNVEFTSNFNTGYFEGLTFKKIKGGGCYGGNYLCVEQNDEYRVFKY
jgi:hypothetical protein